jgi:hypothetical protein
MNDDNVLFPGFGTATGRKARAKKVPTEVRLYPPWVLLHSVRDIPRAHILVADLRHPSTPMKLKEGAVRALCGKVAGRVDIDDGFLAPMCAECSKISGRTS